MFTNRKTHVTAFPSRLVGSVTSTQNLETGTYGCQHVTNVLFVHSECIFIRHLTFRRTGTEVSFSAKGVGIRLLHHGPLVAKRRFRAYRKYSRMSDEQQKIFCLNIVVVVRLPCSARVLELKSQKQVTALFAENGRH